MQGSGGAEIVCKALGEVAARGGTVVVYGRDLAMRAIAERNGWRQLALVDGTLRPLSEIATDIDAVLDAPSAPLPILPETSDDDIPNVVPFPLSARTAGVA